MKPDYARPILLVSRFDECFRFYRDVMGFKVAWGEEGGSYCTFVAGEGIRLSLFKRADMAEAIGTADLPSDPRPQDRIAIDFGVEDFAETFVELRRKGAEFVTPITDKPRWGVRTVFLRDPDGNLLQLETELPRGKWSKELREDSAKY